MYTLYKFHFLNGINEINQLFDDILIIWPAPVYSGEHGIKQQTFSYENTSITAFTKIYTVVHLLVTAQTCSYSIAL